MLTFDMLRYAECTPRGRLVLQLCPDGYALDLQHGVCDLASKVNCEGRTKQQASEGIDRCEAITIGEANLYILFAYGEDNKLSIVLT